MSHPFDLFCRNHPERPVCEEARAWGAGRDWHLCLECYNKAMQEGARQADATWWQQPHERSVGRSYKRVCIGALPNTNIPVWEQIEDWK